MRQSLRYVAAATVVALAACSDSGTAPTAPAARDLSSADRPSLDLSSTMHWGYRTATFTLTAAGGVFDLSDGFYTLTVPADAVCSLNSTYGPGTWDTPCTTLGADESITVTATYGLANGGPVVDFSPELRFNPNTSVTLSTSLYAPILTYGRWYFQHNPSALRYFGMYYVANLESSIVTDAASDPSLVTHVNLTTGLVWRRVKHFSGYSVTSGLACDPSPGNPDCVDTGGPVVDQQP